MTEQQKRVALGLIPSNSSNLYREGEGEMPPAQREMSPLLP